MDTQTPWLELLSQLRPRLAGRRDGHGHVGSLRWLENQMSQKGSSSGAVRNIVYRDIGTPTDKSTLRDILEKLAQDVGMIGDLLPQIALEGEMDLEVRQLLGREKRMVYRRFLNQLRGGKQPKMLVIGRHGAGKTMLMHQISTSYPDAFKIRIGGDFSSELERLAERLSLPSSVVAAPLSRLEPGAPFAVSGGLQAEISKQLVAALLKRGGRILLLRAGTRGNLGGNALRLTDGSSATPTRWAWHHLLEPLLNADLSVLALINDLEGLPANLGSYGDPVELPPPTLEEARRFVRSKLPHLPPLEVERIVKQAGRDYEALGLLTLLSGVGPIEGESLPVLRDERLRDFLEALSVACPPEFGETDERILLGLLGRKTLDDFPSLEKAFLETAGRGRIRPTSRSLAEKLLERYSYDREARRTELQNKASSLAEELSDLERALHHALGGAAWTRVADLISRGEGHLTFSTVENVWRVASEAAEVPDFCLDQLGQVVVEHYANLGRHSHYSMKKALEGLKNSQDPNLQIYAKVKEAEGLIDHARFEAAREAFQKLPADADRNLSAATRAELGLGYAAFARWEGNALQALGYVEEAVRHSRGVNSELLSTKVQYWRGLIHKDLGQWSEALTALGEVTLGGIPLLSSRARYHLGDMWMRLGQQEKAKVALELAIEGLKKDEAPGEEVSRARTGLGTSLRRLGELEESARAFTAAAVSAPDDFTRARAQSEAVLLYAAKGQYNLALSLGHWAWERFAEGMEVRPAEAHYRKHRVQFRVAMVYMARGLGQPYLPPLRGATLDNYDLQHARALLQDTLHNNTLDPQKGSEAERDAALRMDVYLGLGLCTPDPEEAVVLMRRGLDNSAHPYHEFQARTYLAESLLRAGKLEAALGEVNRAHACARRAARIAGVEHLSEPSFTAWLALLEAQALLPEDPKSALETLQAALHDPQLKPFHSLLASEAASSGFSLEVLKVTPSPLLRDQDAARAGFESW